MTSLVYLDHAGSAPLRATARDAMARSWRHPGNASAVHAAGRAARRIVEESREQIAAALGAHPTEVLLTSGGTEADNLAIRGLAEALRAAADGGPAPRVVTTAIEHDAVLGPATRLGEDRGLDVTLLPVGRDGLLDPDTLAAELARTAPGQGVLLSIQAANSEVGAVQDLAALTEVARTAHARIAPARTDATRTANDRTDRIEPSSTGGPAPLVIHSDAVQAAGSLPVDFGRLGLDAMSVSAHKLGGPTGVGALLVRRGAPLAAIMTGGGQERGLRPGTYDVAGIAGMAAALTEARADLVREADRLRALRDQLAAALLAIDGVALTGPALDQRHPSGAAARLPGNVHVTVTGARSELLLFALDAAGICASAGSACHAGVTEPSRVVLALGLPEERAMGAVRFTLGHTTTSADVAAVAAAWPDVVAAARAASPARAQSPADAPPARAQSPADAPPAPREVSA